MMNNSPYAPMITAAAQKYGVDPNLALRLVRQESGFNQGSVSNRGAVGLTQLMPGTASDLGVNPNDPAQNVDGGMRYLKQMQDRYGGSVPLALAAYNAGPARVDAYLKNGTALPSETTNYVQSIQGTPMADPNTPALASQMQMAQAQQAAPTPVQQAMQGGDPGTENFFNSLQRAGAWLTSINNPSGGAALLNATNLPLFRQRYQVVSDPYGGQHVFDLHRGIFVNSNTGSPVSGGGGNAAPSGDTATNLAQTPAALKARLEQDQKDSAARMQGLDEAANNAYDLIDTAHQAKRLASDPNVYQGGGGDLYAEVKNYAPGFVGLKGNDQTQALEKLNSQLQGQFLSAQKGVRFAGPEIKFGELANADLSKPRAANLQIYDDAIQKAQRVIAARDIARQHMQTRGVLGPEYSKELQAYTASHPIYQDTAVQPGSPAQSNRPPLSDIFK